ncbi:hypothetical protein BC831DRAFT_188962 [Entophlyctis helioformis]|nr:hypothetical protein BC831DRAFT_188962 [Entophlyctis helioformis]
MRGGGRLGPRLGLPQQMRRDKGQLVSGMPRHRASCRRQSGCCWRGWRCAGPCARAGRQQIAVRHRVVEDVGCPLCHACTNAGHVAVVGRRFARCGWSGFGAAIHGRLRRGRLGKRVVVRISVAAVVVQAVARGEQLGRQQLVAVGREQRLRERERRERVEMRGVAGYGHIRRRRLDGKLCRVGRLERLLVVLVDGDDAYQTHQHLLQVVLLRASLAQPTPRVSRLRVKGSPTAQNRQG